MHSRTRIKVCGITHAEDAIEAIRIGVDAIGFIFVESSPRYISPEKAKEIVSQLPPFIHLVGVFVDKDPIEVQEIIDYCGLTYVQLHGNEDTDYCQKLAQAATPCRLLKAFRVGPQSRPEEFSVYEGSVNGFLLDTFVDGKEGGTGKSFDWSIVKNLGLRLPVILAGGLTENNIAEAVQAVKPFAVDVNSGVELGPGRKDLSKINELVKNLAAVDAQL